MMATMQMRNGCDLLCGPEEEDVRWKKNSGEITSIFGRWGGGCFRTSKLGAEELEILERINKILLAQWYCTLNT